MITRCHIDDIHVTRRLSRIPWTARKSSQSILKEINPEYSLEGLMLKLKLQYFGHLMQSTDSLENSQEDKRVTEDVLVGWHCLLNGHKFEQTPGDGEGQGSLACCSPWGRKELDTTEHLKNNTTCGKYLHEVSRTEGGLQPEK